MNDNDDGARCVSPALGIAVFGVRGSSGVNSGALYVLLEDFKRRLFRPSARFVFGLRPSFYRARFVVRFWLSLLPACGRAVGTD